METEDSEASNDSLERNSVVSSPSKVLDMLSQENLSYVESRPQEPEQLPFGGDIPRLSVSMTPWRKLAVSSRNAASFENSYLDSNCGSEPLQALPTFEASPLNSRPHTRNSLFSEDGTSSAATATASASSSNEIEQLQRQLTTCKLKLRILTELLKELNYTHDVCGEDGGPRSQVYEKLIQKLPAHDKVGEISKELNELRQNLDIKNKELIELKQELVSSKDEYHTVLNDVNSYLEHSDVIAGNIDELLAMFSASSTLSAEELDALEKARSISNNFVDVKMSALTSTVRRFLDMFAAQQSWDSRDTSSSSVLDDSHVSSQNLDSRLEGAIENMHEEYHEFLISLQDKMKHCAETEKTLEEKLEKQRALIAQFASHYRNQDACNAADRNSELHENGNEREPISYALNLKSSFPIDAGAFDLKNSKVKEHGDRPSADNGMNGIAAESSRVAVDNDFTLQSLDDNKWLAEKTNLTEQLSDARSEVQQLTKQVKELKSEISVLQSDSEHAVADLEKTLKRAVRKSGLYMSENRDMHSRISAMEHELENLTNHNKQLQKNTSGMKRDYSLLVNEYQKLRNHLLLHLNKVFDVFDKILQKHSINQAKSKLKVLEELNTTETYRASHAKLESLYVFIETAINSVVEEHAKMLLKEKERRASRLPSQKEDTATSSSLRIELLERKWIAERERRKLDAAAAEYRISHLEEENRNLRQRLRQSYQSGE
ncbi:LAME_0B00782g1_1 [Lachancea meyersii CBS 8951]|uniref:LAME_0B00782g1_1 n=1 Tax=Lachancea meyersii CBS 8951 TaxID=1266667 RepID=A0A1G4ISJ5_9SACH|nr:LAME_0B00782g1_1 [Lachancea meyersii CBS 8951]